MKFNEGFFTGYIAGATVALGLYMAATAGFPWWLAYIIAAAAPAISYEVFRRAFNAR